MPAPSRSARLVIAACCLALVVSGCGGGDDEPVAAASPTPPGSGDAALITDVATEVLVSDDLTRKCEQLVTPGFVLAVFGDQETCTQDPVDSTAEDATGAEVSDVVVDGDSATATVTEEGGSSAGASGPWRFTRDSTGGWRLSEWSIDYLRSLVAATFGDAYASDGPEDPFDDADFRSCFVAALQSFDDRAFRTVMYALIAQRDDADDELNRAAEGCGEAASGEELTGKVTEIREAFETAYRAAASRARPGADVDCELAALRRGLTDEEIVAAEEGDTGAQGKLERIAGAAQVGCSAPGGGSDDASEDTAEGTGAADA